MEIYVFHALHENTDSERYIVMKRTVFSVKKGLTRSVACLLAAVMLLCVPAAVLTRV